MTFDRWTRKYLRRLQMGLFLQLAAEWLGIFLLSYGSLVLIVKLTLPALWPHVLWLGVGAIPLAVAAWAVSQRNGFRESESVAYLDRRLGAGGLLMTLSEAPDAEWQARLPQMETVWKNSLPRFRPKRFIKLVGIPLLFCIACGFVPLRESEAVADLRQSNTERNVQELQEMMEALEEEEILEKEEAEKLKEELENLLEVKNEPLTHEKWETVDALRQKMQLRLDRSAMSVAKASAAAETLAKATQGNAQALTPEQIEQLSQQIAEGLAGLSGQQSGRSGQLSDKLGQMMANGRLQLPSDPQARQQMLQELQDMLKQESQKLSELRSQCQGGQCQNGQCEGGMCQNGQCDGNIPGRGGVTRGRADADLNYGHETDDQNVKFKETVLPKGFLDEANEDVLRVTLAPPQEDVAESAPRNAQRLSDPATGQATWNRRLPPRHRRAVKGYFDSE